MNKKFWKLTFLPVILLAILTGCEDIPRDNIFDPKNPDSFTDQVILVEAFVNTFNPLPYNLQALRALTNLEAHYGEKIAVVTYHRNQPDYPDSLALPENENLYSQYLEEIAGAVKGTPDIFVNGTANRVQGASSSAVVEERVGRFINDLLGNSGQYLLQPFGVSVTAGKVSAGCRIARLGNQEASQLRLRLIALKDLGGEMNHTCVGMRPAAEIPGIPAGEYVERQITEMPCTRTPDALLFVLTTADGRKILQVKKVLL